jgi:ATP-dependent Clp protease adaptor protein ClpS
MLPIAINPMVKELTQTEQSTNQEETSSIILFNDDHNSFEWVITSLMEVCDHAADQAEQCAWIVHYKGKYAVKSGSRKELRPRCEALLERGLTAELA